MSSIAGPSTASQVAPVSSDDDVQMVDSNGEPLAATTAPTDPTVEPLPSADAPVAADDQASAGNNSEVPEDEYEIEYIVSHSQETTDGQISYYVKWKGYPDSENSWVLESDMGGAQEMIQEYWAKVPKKGVKKMGVKGGKKGRRQSSVGAAASGSSVGGVKGGLAGGLGKKRGRRGSSLLLNGDTPSRKAGGRRNGSGVAGGELAHSRSPTPDDALIDVETDPALQRIRSDPSLTDDQRAQLEAQHLHAIKLDRLRKRYARIADWDPIVKRVEAVEKMSDNKLRVFVHFESGDRLAFESVVAHHRCPLKLLQFYEAHLRFKRKDDTDHPHREDRLRGEEDQTELDQYTKQHQHEQQLQDQASQLQDHDHPPVHLDDSAIPSTQTVAPEPEPEQAPDAQTQTETLAQAVENTPASAPVFDHDHSPTPHAPDASSTQ